MTTTIRRDRVVVAGLATLLLAAGCAADEGADTADERAAVQSMYAARLAGFQNAATPQEAAPRANPPARQPRPHDR